MNVSIPTTTADIQRSSANFSVLGPLSMAFAIIAIIIASQVLIWICFEQQFHSITNMLVCNICVASILYCTVQLNNYSYLLFITWDTDDMSCRWRAYFAYVAVVAVVYSYLLQALSRLFFTVFSTQYAWLTSLKTQIVLLVVEWIMILVVPLPALMTKDITFRPSFLCWVPAKFILHTVYTVFVYYLIPTLAVIIIYITIFVHIKRSERSSTGAGSVERRHNRDLQVLRNIVILFGIYILGGIPWGLYIVTKIEFLYSCSIVTTTLAVAIEKAALIALNREMRNSIRKRFSHLTCRPS